MCIHQIRNGQCTFEDECWYVHEEKSNNESNSESFKCDMCKSNYKGRSNFMKHKKLLHPEQVPSCEKFSTDNCKRNENDCWFEHRTKANNYTTKFKCQHSMSKNTFQDQDGKSQVLLCVADFEKYEPNTHNK